RCTVQAHFHDEWRDFIAKASSQLAVHGVTIRLHAYDEPELAGARADAEEIGMRERLAAAQYNRKDIHRREIDKECVVLLERQRLSAQRQIVVAEEAVEIAAIRQLQE